MLHLTFPIRLLRPLLMLALLAGVIGAQAQHDCRSTKQQLHGGQAKGGGGGLWPFEILHQRIELDLTVHNTLKASCLVRTTPRQPGLSIVPLDLLALTVDSVSSPTGPLVFTHVGETLGIDLGTEATLDDTLEFTVHYRGSPALDPSGFGGFYLTATHAYNLGVAFQSVPHSYGRAWFPCVDNFTERNSYEFVVRTANGRKAWCNGHLVSETALGGDTLIRHWRMDETMPAYLASVAASDYTVVRDTFPSIGGGPIPVELVARAPDTTNMKASFIHLRDAFDAFEDWFGPYRWNKVGYVLTPQGAMEHSTSVHYPSFIANGNLQYEGIMAHELAHQWWGDLVTCDRAEEMWINEGFAEYLSFLFEEWVYGPGKYRQLVKSNHRKMVHRAHLIDQGWWALSEVPQQWTYGEHSYNKGADACHTLRGYLGDDLFRTGLMSFLQAHAFQPVNSEMMRDHLTQVTGVDMTDFFTDRIQRPGWSSFEVDSFSVGVHGGGTWPVTVHVQQKLRGPAQWHHNVPLRVTFMDDQGMVWSTPDPVTMGGAQDSFTLDAPLVPTSVILNIDERISMAVTSDMDTLLAPGIRSYAHADLRLTVTSVPGPVPIRLEEYWVAADEDLEEPWMYVASPDRWWRILGNIPEEAVIVARIDYDGRTTNSASYDVGLMQDHAGVAFHEDSLVLLYRPDQRMPWGLHPNFTVNPLVSPTDKWGRVEFSPVKAGEYALGFRKGVVGMSEAATDKRLRWSLRPNPVEDLLTVELLEGELPPGLLMLHDAQGRLVREVPWQGGSVTIRSQGLAGGAHQLGYRGHTGAVTPIGRVVIAR